MPRSTAKARVDKSARRPSVQLATPQAEDVEDIVPGRLTKTQWTDLLIQEDADDTVGEIMEELLSKVMEGCFKVYIKNQLASFSAFWAKSYLTQIVDQQLLFLDEGERPEDTAKTEDSEHLPTISDPWAQGCVPVVKATTPRLHPNLQMEADAGQVSVQKEASTSWKYHATIQTSSSSGQSEGQTDPRMTLAAESHTVFPPHPPAKITRSKIQPLNLLPKPVQSKLLPPLSCSVEKWDVGVQGKNRTHSVSSHMSGLFYQQKDHKAIPKLDPSCLPRHSIFPQYEIVENNSPRPFSKTPSTLSKLEPRTNKQQIERTEVSLKLLSSSTEKSAKVQRRNGADIWLKKVSSSAHRSDGSVSSKTPFRLDKMELAEGVSILNSQTTDTNSFKLNSPAQSTKLQPMQHDAALPLFSVDQVTTGCSPQVTPLIVQKL